MQFHSTPRTSFSYILHSTPRITSIPHTVHPVHIISPPTSHSSRQLPSHLTYSQCMYYLLCCLLLSSSLCFVLLHVLLYYYFLFVVYLHFTSSLFFVRIRYSSFLIVRVRSSYIIRSTPSTPHTAYINT